MTFRLAGAHVSEQTGGVWTDECELMGETDGRMVGRTDRQKEGRAVRMDCIAWAGKQRATIRWALGENEGYRMCEIAGMQA